MRTLNRPMFRYGGPIKEGVMNGIREPKKHGGSMTRRAALVGDPNFPQTDGRAHHVAPIVYGVGMGLARAAPLALRYGRQGVGLAKRGIGAIKNMFGKNVPKNVTVPKQGPFTQGSAVTKNTFGAPYTTRTAPVGPGSAQSTVNTFVPNKFGEYLSGTMSGKLVSGLYKGATSPTAVGLTQKAGKAVWSVAKDPITIASAGFYFYPDGTPKSDEEIANQGDAPAGGLEGLLKTSVDNGATKNENILNKADKRKADVKKYRDIMDIKGMNKDAAYNSLIAASQAVLGEGDFKGSLKDGSLINKIIGSTSKAFDKPKATKDAIDTLILKGEIDKDLNADKNKLMDEYRMKQIQLADKQLNVKFSDNKIVASKNMSGQAATDAAASSTSDNFRGNIVPNSEWVEIKADIKEKGGGLDDITIIANWTNETIKGKQVPDGDYTVGDALVTIEAGQVVNVKR